MDIDTMQARLIKNSQLDDSTGCWIWRGNTGVGGYGKLSVRVKGKANPVSVYAHRMAFTVFTGKPLRSGYHIDHVCRNSACINPAHLRQVKAADNLRRRRYAKGTFCTRCGRAHSIEVNCKKD